MVLFWQYFLHPAQPTVSQYSFSSNTLRSDKTPTHVFFYISPIYQIFRECLRWIKYSIDVEVQYSLLRLTSFRRYISVFVSNGFYRLRQTFDKMFASQQGLCSHRFVQDVSGQTVKCWWSEKLRKLTDRQYRPTAGSGRPRSACTPANINQVERLALSQEDKPQFTAENCTMEWHIFGFSHNST